MINPLISVIVPIHNGTKWIQQTLDSLFSQTYPSFEIILINDASNDNLKQVLSSVNDNRLHAIHLEKNVGVSAARNFGIRLAKGDFIAFCDADDVCHPQRFEKQVNFLLQNTEFDLCGSAFTCFDTEDRITVNNPVDDLGIKRKLMQGNAFGLSTVMARSRIFKLHHFNENLKVSEDYDLWTRLATSGIKFSNLPESLLRYRWHSTQASRHQSSNLDQVSRRIRSLYCAHLLGDPQLISCLQNEIIKVADLNRAKQLILHQNCYESRDFRFMLSWMYQILPCHGLKTWWKWNMIQKTLNLNLNLNYRFNIFLLSLIPKRKKHLFFDVLIKLKY